MHKNSGALAALRLAALAIPSAALGADPAGADFFERYVRPVLAQECYVCHSNAAPQVQGGLRVDTREAMLKGGARGPAITPGDAENSSLVRALRHVGDLQMPPARKLENEQIERIAAWVRMGAPTADDQEISGEASKHWSLIPPGRPEPPASVTGWASSPVDQFIEARLTEAGLQPSAEANPRTLVRRLYHDLTGLPPSPRVVEDFVKDPSESRYTQIVEDLLRSERFGERWARHWLDIVRYSDEGFQARPFPIAWTYRDWTVNAFNEDMPFDQFVRLQLAADLVDADIDDQAALGLLTLGINLPRPTDVPENIDDRIDVVTRGFLGLSVACARCHDHKFDPIPQEDYYALYGVFLNSPDRLEPVPMEQVPADAMGTFFSGRLAERRAWLDRYREERLVEHIASFREEKELARYLEFAWALREQSNNDAESLSKEKDLNLYVLKRWREYLNGLVGPSVDAFADLDQAGGAERIAKAMLEADSDYRWPDPTKESLRLALRGNGSPTDVPIEDFWWVQNEGDSNVVKTLKWQYNAVMREWSHRGGPAHASTVQDAHELQPAHLFRRGNQHDKGDPVDPRFLSCLPGPEEFQSGSGRLELAEAIASPDNPLTARVAVNRVWGRLFGEGIVRTPSDFGLRGDRPSHPELLDYLANDFVHNGWSVKGLIRELVQSKAYRQASVAVGDGVKEDPQNQLLWRQNRVRLDFEVLRDSMLAVAGMLEPDIGGAPFELQATPASKRRTLYAYVSREEPSAVMRAFDFSNPEEHTPKRQLTTVPQQALFLMNSAFLGEVSRALAADCGAGETCVNNLYKGVLGRNPSASERETAIAFLQGGEDRLSAASESADESSPWEFGTSRLDPDSGTLSGFEPMRHRVGDRLQTAPEFPSRQAGRASITLTGGHPGDDLDKSVVFRWTAPNAMKVSISGTLRHFLGDLGTRFNHSNGVRGWIISSETGAVARWKVRGFSADTTLSDLPVGQGERLAFVVDAMDDYESDNFQWSPVIEEVLSGDAKAAGSEARKWTVPEGFPAESAEPLSARERLAQVLLMTNEFAFRD